MVVRQRVRVPATANPALAEYYTIGSSVMDFVINRAKWIHRIVETVTFVDDRTVFRHLSVDLTIPDSPLFLSCTQVLGAGTYVLPVALLDKVNLVAFDVTDEAGRALPILTKRENALVSIGMLATVRLTRPSWERPLRNNLSNGFFLCVILQGSPRERRVIKYSYQENLQLEGSTAAGGLWARTLSFLGWDSRRVRIPCPAAAFSTSYHIEAILPDDLFFEEARLAVKRVETGTAETGGTHYLSDPVKNVRRSHLRVERLKTGRRVDLEAQVRPRAGGLITWAWALGAVVTAMLLVGLAVAALGGTASDEGAASLLLVIPAVFGAIVFRPGEHRLVSLVVRGVSLWARLLALVSLGAAGILAVRVASGARFGLWLSLAVLAVLFTAAASLPAIQTSRAERH